jgi:hypothetical protein
MSLGFASKQTAGVSPWVFLLDKAEGRQNEKRNNGKSGANGGRDAIADLQPPQREHKRNAEEKGWDDHGILAGPRGQERGPQARRRRRSRYRLRRRRH